MNQNVLKVVDIYCQEELNSFKMDKYYKEILELTQKLNLKLVCDSGQLEEKDKKVYLSISIYNQKDEIIEVYDEGILVASTILVFVDKKEKIKFFSWIDEDFIDSLRWIIRTLKNFHRYIS